MLTLNYRDSRPIYEQIKDGLRRMIVTGAMAQDEKLPSVRALATQLSINPNTIQRAYNELEEERRLCYVAITRAKQHLVITYGKGQLRQRYGGRRRRPAGNAPGGREKTAE